ncbi:hypothetical protein EVAR_3848_1 [Eumeta japonica]|uniref:Uncharacterized protein n=1 Tax=Eumeta variegata TaxID=151549 RepID=A0A4C1SQN0_EUMVA|nr:hypothetical protein EVAR_3848_1 [Eumeta japonica]
MNTRNTRGVTIALPASLKGMGVSNGRGIRIMRKKMGSGSPELSLTDETQKRSSTLTCRVPLTAIVTSARQPSASNVVYEARSQLLVQNRLRSPLSRQRHVLVQKEKTRKQSVPACKEKQISIEGADGDKERLFSASR